MIVEFEDASPLLTQPDRLREQADKDGFLFVRGLLRRERVLRLREEIMAVLDGRGLLKQGTVVSQGIADMEAIHKLDLDRTDIGLPAHIYLDIQRLKLFQEMLHEPELLHFFRLLFDAEPFPHPKTIGRIMLPHRQLRPTPQHQDFIHIQGTTTTWTSWFPLGDTPKELGGLSILKGSHKLGTLSVAPQQGAGGLEAILCNVDLDWAEGDYEAGDVIVFHSQTVHKALPNRMGDRIRLSCDFRYQPVAQQIDPRSLNPHVATWEQIYEGWPDEQWKYYWKSHPFLFSEWDESIRWQKDNIC